VVRILISMGDVFAVLGIFASVAFFLGFVWAMDRV
jgi:hypothetical protein